MVTKFSSWSFDVIGCFYTTVMRPKLLYITAAILVYTTMFGQSEKKNVNTRNYFFYVGGTFQYYPRLIEYDVSRPELFHTTPRFGYGMDLIGCIYEFKKGKYALGAQFGTETQEWYGDVGWFDPNGEGYIYPVSEYIESAFGWLQRPVFSMDFTRRFNINKTSDLNVGLFAGVDGYRDQTGSSTYRLSPYENAPYMFVLTNEVNSTDENKYTYGLQAGFTRNNWELNYRFEFIHSQLYYYAFVQYSQTPPDNLENYQDTYKKRQYYSSLNLRYYFGRKGKSRRFH